MPNVKHMRALGRRGGLRGGPARAKALDLNRRTEISRDAARVRWQPEVLVLAQPRDLGELECFVAQYGNGYAQHGPCDPAAVLVRAIVASRNNACLARMIPVFIWRARGEIFEDPKKLVAVSALNACALGYLLELTQRFVETHEATKLRGAKGVIRALRQKSRSIEAPFTFFHSTGNSLARREHAERLTSPAARSWNLVIGEPDESFESYFTRAAQHAAT
jgi:hypothetical protein